MFGFVCMGVASSFSFCGGHSRALFLFFSPTQPKSIAAPLLSGRLPKIFSPFCWLAVLHLDGEFSQRVQAEDSMWTLEDRKTLHLSLEKTDKMRWWSCVLKGDPEIDTKTIVPEVRESNHQRCQSPLDEMDTSVYAFNCMCLCILFRICISHIYIIYTQISVNGTRKVSPATVYQ